MTNEENALYRCELAELFTSPSHLSLPPPGIYLVLQKRGLIEWRSGFRLTQKGRIRLRQLRQRGLQNYEGD